MVQLDGYNRFSSVLIILSFNAYNSWLCQKLSPFPTTASILRQLCDDLAAAEEEGEESAGQDAGHRGRHQAQREPHALLNRLNDPKSHRD